MLTSTVARLEGEVGAGQEEARRAWARVQELEGQVTAREGELREAQRAAEKAAEALVAAKVHILKSTLYSGLIYEASFTESPRSTRTEALVATIAHILKSTP